MAEKIVSPGVFTNEKDLSFLPAGIAAIGAVVIGPTQKGPAFIPTAVENFNDFIAKFGGLSEQTYVPYTVKSYLNSAATVTVVRVLTEGGYNAKSLHLIHSSSVAGNKLVGVIMPTTTIGSSTGKGFEESTISPASPSASSSFGLILSGSGVSSFAISASVKQGVSDTITNVLGTSVVSGKVGYLYTNFSQYLSTATAMSGTITIVKGANALVDYSSSIYGKYAPASTPLITSQIIGGQTLPLFKVVTLADGTDTNSSLKISIINTTLPGSDPGSAYGSFTLAVREYGDTDQRPVILETYTNLTLDPNSSNYISRRIGDKYSVVSTTGGITQQGSYNNVSKYIRVVAEADVENGSISPNVKPFGFQNVIQPISSSYAFPDPSLITKDVEINNSFNKKAYYGWNYNNSDNQNYLAPIAFGTAQISGNSFNLDRCFLHPSASKINSVSTFVAGASISATGSLGIRIKRVLYQQTHQ